MKITTRERGRKREGGKMSSEFLWCKTERWVDNHFLTMGLLPTRFFHFSFETVWRLSILNTLQGGNLSIFWGWGGSIWNYQKSYLFPCQQEIIIFKFWRMGLGHSQESQPFRLPQAGVWGCPSPQLFLSSLLCQAWTRHCGLQNNVRLSACSHGVTAQVSTVLGILQFDLGRTGNDQLIIFYIIDSSSHTLKCTKS